MTFSKYIEFFFKEFNKNKSKASKVFFTIFVSLLIFSSVIILKNSIENEIKSNSRLLLGGDLEISAKNEALNLNLLNQLKKTFFITKLTEFTSIIRTNNDVSKTTRIKAIDNFYPLVGEAIVEPYYSLQILKNTPNTILIDRGLQNNLDLKLGNKLKYKIFHLK